ncbi:MAG: hypothetical protein HFH75_17995 [Lachnospiraceae bacterium]|jgi:hypothetical protein|nr:hypothetical protein [Lachnospiraceae bacterium]MDE6990022.1 hypothetical protein [Lachnospiraceae bacterium]MDE7002525.1 hypothetical protein [Lachnospiraceae bacterium]
MSMMLGISVSNRKRMEIKDMSGKVVGSVTVTKGKASQVVVKKRLPYSFKEISTRLLKTKKSGNAHQVLISARQKAVSLRLMYKGGVYDDDEVLAALMHAQAIVRVAKKREKHLQEEERAEKKIGKDGVFCEADLEEKTEEASSRQTHKEEREQTKAKMDLQRMQKLMEQYERMMQEAMKELEQLDNMDALSEELGIDGEVSMDPEDLELMKKKHRADEMRAIVEADMKYLKFMFDKLEKERQSNNNSISSYSSVSYDSNSSANDSVSLELGGVDIPVEAAPDAMTIVEGGAVDVEA